MSLLSSLKNRKGFTILEALLAVFVISIGALAIAEFLNRSVELSSDAEARTEAIHLAKKTIAGFRDFTTKAEVVAFATDATGNTVAGDHETYTRTWTVADVTGNSNAVLLTVNVAWTGVNGAQNVTLASEIAKLEPNISGAFVMDQSIAAISSPPTDVTTTTTSTTTTTTTTIAEPPDTTSTTTTSTSTTTTTTIRPIIYSCTCTWDETINGQCSTPAIRVDSEPERDSCCSTDACSSYVPTDPNACKFQTGTSTFSCSGDGGL